MSARDRWQSGAESSPLRPAASRPIRNFTARWNVSRLRKMVVTGGGGEKGGRLWSSYLPLTAIFCCL